MSMAFSVLMSIYRKEKPEYFERAMRSIWDEQTIQPDEIVLVQDGQLTDELYLAIEQWKRKLGDTLNCVVLEHNLGLGDALNEGLNQCQYEIIARMDTDDIALPLRFERQLNAFKTKNIDVCSSWVGEFDLDEEQIVSYRVLPETHKEIDRFAKKRNPLNHPAVMYKKSAVIEAGGYLKMMWFEDYYLWVRMLMSGALFYNIQEPLVNMRAGYGQLERRSGSKYGMAELEFQKKMLKIGFVDLFDFYQNVLLRLSIRLLPKKMIAYIYKKMRG
jgi:glycosyltransferase involved in cell wall biosynthesis